MVRVLIDLRRTVRRHGLARVPPGPLVAAGLLGLVSAAGTFAAGFARAPDLLAALFALWIAGQVTQSALTGGEATLRPQVFALLPLPPRRLARALLAVGLLEPVLVFLLLAFAGLVPCAARSGPAAIAVACAAAVLTVAMTSVLSTVAGALLAPGSRRGRDGGTVVLAVALSLVAVAGTLLPTVVSALRRGSAPWLSDTVRALPSGWGADAVAAAGRSDWSEVVLALAAPAVLGLAAAALWPAVLRRAMTAAPRPTRGGSARAGRPLLPRTPVGAVAAKETRLWVRDPIRLTCLLIAVVVGAGVCAIPRATTGTGLLMPFGGALTVIIAAACACNLYGSDGTSLWLTVVTPGSGRADVRGRQLGWLLLVGPYCLGLTVVMTALSGRPSLWPWALAVVPALLGGGAGLAAFGSLVSVQPFDDTGNPTPAWSVKVHLALYAVAATALPPVALLVAGTGEHVRWLTWTAVPVGVLTGVLLARGLGALAERRLATHRLDVLRTLVAGV